MLDVFLHLLFAVFYIKENDSENGGSLWKKQKYCMHMTD